MDPARTRWLAAYPYLEPLARLHDALGQAPATAALPVPGFDPHQPDYDEGVPLLRSAHVPVDVRPAAPAVPALAEAVAAADLPDKLRADARALRDRLRADPAAGGAALAGLAHGDADALTGAARGLHWLLGWTALQRALRPTVDAFTAWRLGKPWTHPECPTCGAPPVLAQLVGTGYRERFFTCGPCRTRWSWKRIGCPHCGNEAQTKLGLLEVEDQPEVRLDVCEACKGYVKTYLEKGDEGFMLSDWSTLHLDVLARKRGYERRGASLYEP
jgi:FdhE protein